MKSLLNISLFVMALCVSSNAFAQALISDIQIEGEQRIEESTVRSYLNVKPGDNFDRNVLNSALKDLFATGLFADIKMRQDGSVLIVEVTENPVVNRILFEGNDEIKDEELVSELSMSPRQVYTRSKVQEDLSRLYQIYQRKGRFSVDIEPKIIELDQNRVDLIYEISEGNVTKIKSIRFVGNEKYGDSVLRGEITSREGAWWRFLTSGDTYDPDRLSYDQELLRQFYLKEGYADFQVVSAIAELSEEKDGFFVTITVDEGLRYKLNQIAIKSEIPNYSGADLKEFITIKSGEWYNAEDIKAIIDSLTDALGDRQYAFVNIRPDIKRNRENATIDLTFVIEETNRVFVERIDVAGNVRTLDKVVRREIDLVEGDPFNRSKIQKSERSLKNLDYFETVTVDVKPGSAPDKTIIDVDVTEKSTGEISLGAGFSTGDGPLVDLRLSERNFLGKGQRVLFSSTLAGERTDFNIGFTEPYFLDRDLSAGFDVFHSTRDLQNESSYDQRRTGGALRFGYRPSEKWYQTFRLRGERNEIENVQSDASIYVQQQEGERNTIGLSQRLVYDDRDNVIFPTEGLFSWLDTEITGFGGDSQYISGQLGSSYHYPVWEQVVFNILGEIGVIEGYGDEIVAINERFYLGGSKLRGFEQGGVGPRDTSTDDALGGNQFYRGSMELSFPLGLDDDYGIKGHAFSDFGSLYSVDDAGSGNLVDENTLRASVGLGISWLSPFGPIRADFAKAVKDEEYDEKEVFRFDFGTRF